MTKSKRMWFVAIFISKGTNRVNISKRRKLRWDRERREWVSSDGNIAVPGEGTHYLDADTLNVMNGGNHDLSQDIYIGIASLDKRIVSAIMAGVLLGRNAAEHSAFDRMKTVSAN